MKILPLVNIFQNGFEVWETRQPTPDEIIKNIQAKLPINEIHQEIKTQLIQTIQTPEDAIKYCLEKNGYCNTFENFIDDELKKSPTIQQWLSLMPITIPPNLLQYKTNYPEFDPSGVQEEIALINCYLSTNQQLIRAGEIDLWNIGESLVTNTPLSTSFCPQIALRNVNHGAKAYNYGRIDIMLINVVDSSTHVFFYNPKQEMGHEKEVLVSAGAKLTLKKRTVLKNEHTVHKYDLTQTSSEQSKNVPVYLVEINLE